MARNGAELRTIMILPAKSQDPRLNPRPDAQIRAPYGAELRGIAHNCDRTSELTESAHNPRLAARNPRAAYSASRPESRAARHSGEVSLLTTAKKEDDVRFSQYMFMCF